MKKDKFIIYITELILLLILFFVLFISNKISNLFLSIFILIYMLFIKFLVKKKSNISFNYKEVMLIMIGFAIIYLVLFYALGLYFGYYKNPITINLNSIINFILPIILIIFASEKMRKIYLSSDNKLSNFFIFIIMVLIDLAIYSKVYNIMSYDDFLTILGLITFSSISCNLLFNYISFRYGEKPVIIYRLITSLYMYIFPIIPDVLVFFRAVFRMLYPYIIYLTIDYTYSKSTFAIAYKDKNINIIKNIFCIATVLLIVMLISCKFRFGLIVIGSGSMSNYLNVGDAIIYERYTKQDILNNDIIIFKKNNVQTIHRVVNIMNNNGEIRYYTKGDANVELDHGYLVSKDIVGIYKFKIKYIGYPTIWIQDLFKK